jgi:hypothetical protein
MLFTINCVEWVSVNITNLTGEVSVEYRTPIFFIMLFGIKVYVRHCTSGTFLENLKSTDTHLVGFHEK